MSTQASVVPVTATVKKSRKAPRRKAEAPVATLPAEAVQPPAAPPVMLSAREAEITAMLEAHSLWLESGGQEGKRANFRGMELEKTDFSGRNLTEANFRGAQLVEANFHKANLTAADFSDAVLSRANLSECTAIAAMFTRAQLAGVRGQHALFGEASFASAEMHEADVEKAVFVRANLRLADLASANLTGADFSDATLREAVLKQARLVEAVLDRADLRESVLTGAMLDHASLHDTQFRGAEILDVDFSRTDIGVAHDLDMRYHLQAFQKEKGQLQEEGMAIDRRRRELRWKESRFEQQQQLFHQQTAVQEHALVRLRGELEDRLLWLRMLKGIWSAVAVTFLVTSFVGATLMALSDEGALILFAYYAVVACISLLFFATGRYCGDILSTLSYYLAKESAPAAQPGKGTPRALEPGAAVEHDAETVSAAIAKG